MRMCFCCMRKLKATMVWDHWCAGSVSGKQKGIPELRGKMALVVGNTPFARRGTVHYIWLKRNQSDCHILLQLPAEGGEERSSKTCWDSHSSCDCLEVNFTLRGSDWISSSWFSCRSILLNVPARPTLEMIPKSMILIDHASEAGPNVSQTVLRYGF